MSYLGADEIASLPRFTPDRPLKLLLSACLVGVPCGVDGTSYGEADPKLLKLVTLPNVKTARFCPEDFSFGTPRAMPDI
ncbi:MAG TPA: hypothetical protein VL588_01960, partial [Bdellovibrionota bacterium]|nr:hypothetical protein [Bdellovibrionota bacterium]